MPRIPENELERLKREVPLERLCERYGIELQSTGKNLTGFCPKHEDKTPSFIVTPEKNLWHCMGACNEGGDNIQLVMRQEKVSFRHAVDIIRQLAGAVPETSTITTKLGTQHEILVQPEAVNDSDLFRNVIDFYHQSFLSIPDAAEYLKKRNCYHPEAVEKFKLGFANRTLGYRIPGSTATGRELKSRLQGLGIIRKSGHEHLSGSVVFPLYDSGGVPVQMYGRKIKAGLAPRTPLHLYLGKPLCGVWNRQSLISQKEWILCEALIDALSCWAHGHRNVTASYGKSNFTADHMELVKQVRPEKIIIAYDNDKPGNAAALELAPKLAAEGVTVHRAELPSGSDINDYVRALAANNPEGIEEALFGIFATAPVIARPDASRAHSSYSLAAKELAAPPTVPPGGPEASSSSVSSVPSVVKSSSPSAIADLVVIKDTPEEVQLRIGEADKGRIYRVRGLARNQAYEVMKINLLVRLGESEGTFYVDTLDLYNARPRTSYISSAAEELKIEPDVLKKDFRKILLKLEELQERLLNKTLAPDKAKAPAMTSEQREAALDLLQDPKLLDRILADLDKCGTVGEESNKLLAYLAAVSRKLDEPLAIIIQSTSAAGKTALMDAILALLPDEEKIKYSSMTGQSLFYLGDMNLKHKVLAIVEEEGAMKASYALKLLQSEGELTIASTGKDPNSGRMVTQEYHVEGPVMIIMTTTSIEIGEELQNRCIVLTVDESREQTRAIHRVQRERYTLEGLLAKKDREVIRATHKAAQQLLRPLGVLNPYARQLTFLDDKTRMRRDHEKYLTLIAAITLLHQYQRPVKTREHGGKIVEYIEVTLDDIAVANRLAADALGRSLDELPPQTRRFLNLLTQMVSEAGEAAKIDREDHRFTQREARAFTGWSDMQVKRHLSRLVDLEYLLVHRGGRGHSYVYELLYDGQGEDGNKFVLGLIDVGELYDRNRDHQKGDRDLSGTPQVHPEYTGGTIAETSTSGNVDGPETQSTPEMSENAYIKAEKKPSHTRSCNSASMALETA